MGGQGGAFHESVSNIMTLISEAHCMYDEVYVFEAASWYALYDT